MTYNTLTAEDRKAAYEAALAFNEQDDDTQAEFFNILATLVKEWPLGGELQWTDMGKHLTAEGKLLLREMALLACQDDTEPETTKTT